jgi:hypothetical protein
MQSLKKMELKITMDKSVEGVQHPITQHIRCVALVLRDIRISANIVYAENIVRNSEPLI